ncbi:hypothetical protein MASR1M12_23630 [Erysipelotrichia bacterium]
MNRIRLFLFSLLLSMLLVLPACDSGSSGPVTSPLSTGPGYKIQLGASSSALKPGATTTLTAVIFEPDGAPIRDGIEVFFDSSQKGSFSDNPVKTSGGTAVVTYTAGAAPWQLDKVSATCRGATANVEITLTSENL